MGDGRRFLRRSSGYRRFLCPFLLSYLRRGDFVAISRDRRSHEMSGGILVRGWVLVARE